MKNIFWYVISLSLTCLITASIVTGPARLYGMFFSQPTDGQLTKIAPYSRNDGTEIDAYLLEISTVDGAVYVVQSDDPQWLSVTEGERVRARLYPTAPWTAAAGAWQNALLVSKLTKNSLPLPVPAPLLASIESTALAASPPAVQTSILADESELIARARESEVAVLRSNGEMYYTPTRLLKDGDHRLGPGHFTIHQGEMEVSMNCGAQLIVEAPADFEILTDRHVHLRHGKLVAEVPDNITDFVLTTATVKISTGPQIGNLLAPAALPQKKDAGDAKNPIQDSAPRVEVTDRTSEASADENVEEKPVVQNEEKGNLGADLAVPDGDAKLDEQVDEEANSDPEKTSPGLGNLDEKTSQDDESSG